ncbi:MAG: tetratricopeptide repeat protein [Candidatus Hodarchaeota archaeon]
MKASEWFYEGVQNMNSRNYEKAVHCFTKSLEYDSQKASPWYNLAIAYLHINLEPFYSLIFYLINFFLLRSNPYYLEDKIITCFKKAVSIEPEFLDAWHNLGYYYYELEEHKKAINCFKEVLKQDSENIETLYFLGIIYKELKEYKTELQYLKKVIALFNKSFNLPIKKIKKRVENLEKNILSNL